jgi:hypothetical protein
MRQGEGRSRNLCSQGGEAAWEALACVGLGMKQAVVETAIERTWRGF